MPPLDESRGTLDARSKLTESPGAGSGREFVSGLPKMGGTPDREKAILAAVSGGRARVVWGTVQSRWKDFSATIFVMRDVLAIGTEGDFVRVSVNARTAQQIADLLGAQLLTPHVADLIYDQAGARIEAQTQTWWKDSSMSRTDRMLEYDGLVRSAFAAAGGRPELLLANMGKHWVITNRLWEPGRAGKAANYGWHTGASSSATLWQPVELGHDLAWVDYSQMVQLMGRVMIVGDQPMLTADVMTSADLYGLVSSDVIRTLEGKTLTTKREGPLRSWRLPGVPET